MSPAGIIPPGVAPPTGVGASACGVPPTDIVPPPSGIVPSPSGIECSAAAPRAAAAPAGPPTGIMWPIHSVLVAGVNGENDIVGQEPCVLGGGGGGDLF